MYAKIQISGTIEIVTGLHIGASGAFSAIGSVDSPVIKDPLNGDPIIPGSSLKGKMRSLLAKQYNNRPAGSPDEDDERLIRLFGSSGSNSKIRRGRLLFSDMPLSNKKVLRERSITGQLTEVKYENTIDRLTAGANPRQIERVIRGAEFPLDLLYEISDAGQDAVQIREDFETIADGLELIQYDYLGGSGSRGYGRVKFRDITIDTIIGDLSEISDDLEETCSEYFVHFRQAEEK